MEKSKALQQWLNISENVDMAAKAFVEVSEKDQRRLKKISYQDGASIWGKASEKIFGENDELFRMFLFTIWSHDRNNIQSRFNNICGKKYIKPTEVVGDLYCICQKKYDKRDPKMVQCSGCANWFHCLCIGLDPNEADLLPDYHCQYCEKAENPPETSKLPESEKLNYSFLQISSADVESFLSPPLRASTPKRCASPALEDDDLVSMVDLEPPDLQELHRYCEKLKKLDSAFPEPHQLPLILPLATDNSDNEDSDTKLVDKQKTITKLSHDIPSKKKEHLINPSTKSKESGNKESAKVSTVDPPSEKQDDYASLPTEFKVTVPYESWRAVCKVEYVTLDMKDDTKLLAEDDKPTCRRFTIKDKEYARPIVKEFYKINPYCVIMMTKKKLLEDHEVERERHQFQCYGQCTRKGCNAHYSFFIHRIPITQRDVELTVRLTSGKIRHIDKGEKATYQLRGEDRKEEKRALEKESALTMRREKLVKANEEGLKDGNLGFAYSLKVLRQTKSEFKHEKDRSTDPFVDLLSTKESLDDQIQGNKFNGYVQDVSILPFKMLLYANVSFDVFHISKQTDKHLTLVIDATDAPFEKFAKPVDGGKSLLYSVLLAGIPKDASEFPILEFTSTRHTFADIVSFFIFYFERYRRLYTETAQHYGVQRVEIDFSKTLLAASIYVFRRSTTSEYINFIWEKLMYGRFTRDVTDKPFVVHVCRFHVLSYMKSEDRHFILQTWARWAHAFVVASDMYSITRRVSDAFILSGSVYFTKEVAECLESISEPTQKQDYKPWMFFETEDQDAAAPFYKQSYFGQYSTSISDCVTFYSSFLKSTKGVSLSQEETAPNPFYSEDLCHYFKVHIFPYIPILTRLQFFLFDLPITEDTTNRIERYHNTIKNVYHKGNYKQRAARFVEAQSTWVLGGAKLILAEISKKPTFKPKTTKPSGPSVQKDLKPTLLDRFREKQSKTFKPTAKISNLKSSKLPQSQVPEDQDETFKTRININREKNAESVIMTATFIKWGGQIRIGENVVRLSNTCNFDTTLMALNILYNFTETGRNFLDKMLENDVLHGESIRQILDDLKHGRVNSAKQIYCTDILMRLERDVINGVLNMFGEEIEHGFHPIRSWMRILRRQRCSYEPCPASKCVEWKPSSWQFNSTAVPIDVERRTLVETVRSNCLQMMHSLNNELTTEDWAGMETKCWHCRESCVTSYFFPGGPPNILFYPLNAVGSVLFDTDETVPAIHTVQGVNYKVFALTLYVEEQVHFILRFYYDDKAYIYDGLKDRIYRAKGFTGNRVVGVWLIKEGLK